MRTLKDVARALVAPGKGILAADESTKSANKRLRSVGIPETGEMRRVYREVFLTAPGIERHLSGVILYDETFNDVTTSGKSFLEVLEEKGIYPGIKVDEGTVPFGGKELVTEGLSGLPERLKKYRGAGARFAKWRAVIAIEGDVLPTKELLRENAKRLGTYAKYCQEADIVPMLEPEVLLQGNHTRARAQEVIEETLHEVFREVAAQGVDPEALILKTSMALSGSESCCKDTPEEVAEDTIEALVKTVPVEVPGIVFLSGGQSAEQATENLQAMATKALPWELTFSYARALQGEALEYWGGEEARIPHAQKIFLKRLSLVCAARDGRYRSHMEEELHELKTHG